MVDTDTNGEREGRPTAAVGNGKPVDSGFPSPRGMVLIILGRYSGSPSSLSVPSRILRSGVLTESSGLQQRGLHRNGRA